ncbi:RNA polymerase factor sigma-54 [candidate division KSB1 bacterium]|nr:RNA polymerase factor sigma-54 [candidate division KSB1 bacterium]
MDLKQSPQQVLLSSLLQLPALSLEQRIKMELEMNPLLELDAVQEEDINQEQEELEEMALLRKDVDTSEDEPKEETPVEEEKEIDWDEILNDEDEYDFTIPRDNNAEEFDRPEASESTLSDNLLAQLYMVRLTEIQYVIGENIIWNINNIGYLSVPVEQIAENLGVTSDEVEEILKIINFFEPVGIGARSLQECLIVQLQDEPEPNKVALDILSNCFEDFKNKRFEKIIKKLSIDKEQLKEAIDEIKKLNPKPGEGYLNYNTNYVVPDLRVRKVDGRFQVELLDDNIPNLRINNSYRKLLLDKKNTTRETKDYIKQRLESARWLINSIHQRRITIKKVMEAIVDKQDEFFDSGPEHIRPMILKDIADEISMDISTVSRVTNGKYVQTDWGVFELKHFFSEKIRQDDGEEVSNKTVKNRIRKIIDDENPKKPLNDQKIAEILKKEGYNVARRTVAKYREQMMLPVSRLRRKI